jgi:peptidoglycan-associated lipoprotein
MRKGKLGFLIVLVFVFSAVFFIASCAPKKPVKPPIDEAVMKAKAVEEERLRADEEAKRKAEEEARQKEEEARMKLEEERLRADEEAKRKTEEEARQKEEEARMKLEEERLKAEMEAEVKPQIAREAEVKAIPELEDIHFDFDKSDIRADARDTLQKNAEWLQKNPDVKIQIEGHCDERGTAEYNLALGDRRAMSTKKYLISLGVSAERIYTISYGEELPIDTGHNEDAWAKNRRGHFLVIVK